MSLSTALLAPFALMLPTAEVVQTSVPVEESAAATTEASAQPVADEAQFEHFTYLPVTFVVHQFPDRRAGQVRIEQTLRIRISPQRAQFGMKDHPAALLRACPAWDPAHTGTSSG